MEPLVAARFGSVLQRLRKEAGLTQAQLAERAQISQRGLQDLERGIHVHPHRTTIDLLAAALGLSGQERAALLAAAQAQPLPPPAAVVPDAPMPLVGRERELALMSQFLAAEDARGSAPRVLLLAGEPGIGKTRLLQAIAQQAIPRGWCVLFGGCQRRGGEDPYAPLPEALARYIEFQPPEMLSAALAGCAWLVRLLPELAGILEPLPAATVAPEQERRLIHAAVARFLANVTGPSGSLLILDDLQWAGPDALDLIDTLARTSAPASRFQAPARPFQAPARIVGAYRDTEVQSADPLGLLLADLAQARLVSRQQLGPLDAADAAELLDDLLVDTTAAGQPPARGFQADSGSGPPPARGSQAISDFGGAKGEVLRRAGGMPFFLVSYAQALQQSGPPVSGSGPEEVPWDVAQGVKQRAAVLPEIARLVLGAAAVVGRRVSRDLLVSAIAQPREAVLAGLEAACQARLLLEDGEDAYSFAHDLIREVLESDLGAARRAQLHGQVAAALEGEPGGSLKRLGTRERAAGRAAPELLAYHYVRAGLSDRAVPYLEMAGDQAVSRYANKVAEEYYREALEHLSLEPAGRSLEDDVARLREKQGLLLFRMGKHEAASALLEAAAAHFRVADDWDGLVRVTPWISWAYDWRGTPEKGIALLEELLQRLEKEAAAPAQGALYSALSRALAFSGQYKEALAACERAIDLARVAADEPTGTLAECRRVALLIFLGRLGDAWRSGQEALPRAELLGDWLCLTLAHRYMAEIQILHGAFETAQEHVARALASATALGGTAQLCLAMSFEAWIALLRGEWKASRVMLERALALSNEMEGWEARIYPQVLLARLCVAEGDRASAVAAAEAANTLVRGSTDLQTLRWVSAVQAELEILEGRPDAASVRLVPLLDRPGLQECDVTMILPVLAWAHLELGQVDVAADVVAQALERARREEMRLVLVDALRVQALIDLRREQWDEAAGSVEEGLSIARSMPYPHAEARLLEVRERVTTLRGRSEAGPSSDAAGLALP